MRRTAAAAACSCSLNSPIAHSALARAGARRSPAAARRAGCRLVVRAEAEAEATTSAPAQQSAEQPLAAEHAAAAADKAPAAAEAEALPEIELAYVEPSGGSKAWTNVKLAFALPWRRFKSEAVLTIKMSGSIAEQPQVCCAQASCKVHQRAAGGASI